MIPTNLTRKERDRQLKQLKELRRHQDAFFNALDVAYGTAPPGPQSQAEPPDPGERAGSFRSLGGVASRVAASARPRSPEPSQPQAAEPLKDPQAAEPSHGPRPPRPKT